MPGSYGFVDVAIFSLENAELAARAAAASALPVTSPLPGSSVRGSGNSGSKLGVIVGIEQKVGDVYVDVVVKVDPPGTFRGDSGMLWQDSAGRAVAIHAKGNSAGPGAGSSLSAAMRADRAVQALGVTFAEL